MLSNVTLQQLQLVLIRFVHDMYTHRCRNGWPELTWSPGFQEEHKELTSQLWIFYHHLSASPFCLRTILHHVLGCIRAKQNHLKTEISPHLTEIKEAAKIATPTAFIQTTV